MAHDRAIVVDGALGASLPGGIVRRGTVTNVDGPGTAAVTMSLLAAASGLGEWVAMIELAEAPSDFAGLAALEAGVALERCAVVRRVERERWAVVVAALLEGMAMVVTPIPMHARISDARRLIARARERHAALVVTGGNWPAETTLRIDAGSSRWHGLERGDGLLARRDLAIRVQGKGAQRHASLDLAARAG
jgi:hypothetical protein